LELIEDAFYRFITTIVSRYIVNTAKLFVKGKLSRISSASGSALIDWATSSIRGKLHRQIVKETLGKWMTAPEDDFVEYLFHVRQSYLCIEILNLDPHCRALEKEEFSKKRPILDTNIVLHRILNCDEQKQLIKLLDNSQKLGCSLFVTERTIQELNDWLEKSNKLVFDVKATPKQLSRMSNLAVRNYAKTILAGHTITKEDYMNRLLNMRIY
jgi:hypothetical protein